MRYYRKLRKTLSTSDKIKIVHMVIVKQEYMKDVAQEYSISIARVS